MRYAIAHRQLTPEEYLALLEWLDQDEQGIVVLATTQEFLYGSEYSHPNWQSGDVYFGPNVVAYHGKLPVTWDRKRAGDRFALWLIKQLAANLSLTANRFHLIADGQQVGNVMSVLQDGSIRFAGSINISSDRPQRYEQAMGNSPCYSRPLGALGLSLDEIGEALVRALGETPEKVNKDVVAAIRPYMGAGNA